MLNTLLGFTDAARLKEGMNARGLLTLQATLPFKPKQIKSHTYKILSGTLCEYIGGSHQL